MSYELISKKTKGASPKAFEVEEEGHRIGGIVNKVVPGGGVKLTRGNTKRSALKGSSIQLEGGQIIGGSVDFNTTFS